MKTRRDAQSGAEKNRCEDGSLWDGDMNGMGKADINKAIDLLAVCLVIKGDAVLCNDFVGDRPNNVPAETERKLFGRIWSEKPIEMSKGNLFIRWIRVLFVLGNDYVHPILIDFVSALFVLVSATDARYG